MGLRDRALIGVMVFTFARISAACGMKVNDIQGCPARQEPCVSAWPVPCDYVMRVIPETWRRRQSTTELSRISRSHFPSASGADPIFRVNPEMQMVKILYCRA